MEEIKVCLSDLEISENIANVTLKDVNNSFRRLAAKKHPDKAGNESTAAFQEMLNACNAARTYFKDKHDANDENNNVDYKFVNDMFEKFNFPFENKGSFTVVVEDHLADIWQECIPNDI